MQLGQIKNYALRSMRFAMGDQTVNKLQLRRNFRHYQQHGIIFIHIPKNAGSSVSRALYGRSLGHWRATQLQAYAPDLYAALPSFAVLRDPVERAYSAWQYCRSAGTAEGWVKDRPEYHLPAFSSFERFATEWLVGRDLAQLDFVFQSQADFVKDAQGQLIVSKLIPLGQLKTDWSTIIEGATPVSRELSVRNKNRSKAQAPEISPQAALAIRDVYAADVALYEEFTS